MATEEDSCYELTPVFSIIACSVLSDLEKQLSLIKNAFIKSELKEENSGALLLSNSTEEDGTVKEQALGEWHRSLSPLPKELKVTEGTALEAKREYGKLRSEFKKLGLHTSGKDEGGLCEENENIRKLLLDVDYIINMVHKTSESLADTNNFFILKEELEKVSQKLDRESSLKSNIEQCKQHINEMKLQIHNVEKEIFLQEQLKRGELNRLKDEYHILAAEGKETLNFAEFYFKAQTRNINCSHRNEMDEKTKEVNQVKRQIDRDTHCLAVMASWTDDFCEQLDSKIDEWKLKFRRDELAMDMRIESKRKAIKAQEELIKSLNETIAERLEELAPWEAEKEVERQERLTHMRRYYSARKIQRWWRGYMVKLKLYKGRRKVKPKV